MFTECLKPPLILCVWWQFPSRTRIVLFFKLHPSILSRMIQHRPFQPHPLPKKINYLIYLMASVIASSKQVDCDKYFRCFILLLEGIHNRWKRMMRSICQQEHVRINGTVYKLIPWWTLLRYVDDNSRQPDAVTQIVNLEDIDKDNRKVFNLQIISKRRRKAGKRGKALWVRGVKHEKPVPVVHRLPPFMVATYGQV